MKTENSLLMRPDMARAYAEDRKWITRRKITRLKGIGKIQNLTSDIGSYYFYYDDNPLYKLSRYALLSRCPYGRPGERIRLLTTWAVSEGADCLKPSELPQDEPVWSYFQGAEKPKQFGRLRPGRFLPLYLRHWMPYPEIISIGAERVQDISDSDAIAEGIDPREVAARGWVDARVGFRVLWDVIHGPGAWERNEWVWPIELQKYSEVSDAD